LGALRRARFSGVDFGVPNMFAGARESMSKNRMMRPTVWGELVKVLCTPPDSCKILVASTVHCFCAG
jgi:hypothetical protein